LRRFLLACALYALFGGTAAAETRYITDSFTITMRTGASTTHKVIKSLRSGARVELLELTEDGYARVRTGDGTEGYVLSRFLTESPGAREKLEKAEKQLAELQQEPDALNQQLAKLREDYDALVVSYNESQKNRNEMQEDLTSLRRLSSDAVYVAQERDQLKKQVLELSQQIEDFRLQTEQLRNASDKKWFVSGAGVVLVGILLGLILPRLRSRRRRDSWGSSQIHIP
jgi:SH3 domain protein